jgi:hypothetical protein
VGLGGMISILFLDGLGRLREYRDEIKERVMNGNLRKRNYNSNTYFTKHVWNSKQNRNDG